MPPSKRQRRADATRREALSPVRIILMVLLLPLTVGVVSAGIFLRISDYDRNEAVLHLLAMAGCDTVEALGFGPFREGQAGYHKRNDPDGDGVACGSVGLQPIQSATPQSTPPSTSAPTQRAVGNAKFVRP